MNAHRPGFVSSARSTAESPRTPSDRVRLSTTVYRPSPRPVRIEASNLEELRDRLCDVFDRNHDDRITVEDFEGPCNAHLAQSAIVLGPKGQTVIVSGPEGLAQMAGVAARKIREGHGKEWFSDADIIRPRSAQLAYEIDQNWNDLRRDSSSVKSMLPALLRSPAKSPDGVWRIYVPAGDGRAYQKLLVEAQLHNQKAKEQGLLPPVEIRIFPKKPGKATWEELNKFPGMAYLPKPFIVPGGMFAEMYGWDSTFIGLGLLKSEDPKALETAKGMLENYVYMLENYGKIPNSNYSFLMSRTQPPLMPRLALALDTLRPDRPLLEKVAAAGQKELDSVWRSGGRRTPSGLSRYYDDAGPAKLAEIPEGRYQHFPDDPEFLKHQRSIRESGHDDTHQYGQEAHHHESLELNSLLYRYERELAEIWRRVEGQSSPKAAKLDKEANDRLATMEKRFWDPEKGMFFDYNFVKDQRSNYMSLATFFPLADGWATQEQAAAVAKNVKKFLEPGGLATTARLSREEAGGESFQWDHPFGWGPLQQIAVEGLRRYGYHNLADEISYRWLSMLLDIAGGQNGLVKEKYDVVNRSPIAEVEYGNQGEDRGNLRAGKAEPMGFGWTNASYVALLDGLPQDLRRKLDQGVSPDEIFPKRGTAGEPADSAAA